MINSIKFQLVMICSIFFSFDLTSYADQTVDLGNDKIKIGIVKDNTSGSGIKDKISRDILDIIKKSEKNKEIAVTYGSSEIIREEFERGELDLIFPIERDHLGRPDSLFSENLYTQDFYVASNRKSITHIGQLNGERIYVPKGSVHKEHLRSILKNNDIYAIIVEVEDIGLYSDEFVASSLCEIYNLNNSYPLGILPSAAVESAKSGEELLRKVNEALDSGARNALAEKKEKLHQEVRKLRFLDSLTPDEMRYLTNLKEIKVGYEENSSVSRYLKDQEKYGGLAPLLLEEISKEIGVSLNVRNIPYESWESILQKFDSDQLDLITMTRTDKRESKYRFSKKIFELNLYKIKKLSSLSKNMRERIGVIENTIEDELVSQYYHPEEIMRFKNFSDLISLFKKGGLTSVISFDSKLVTGKDYITESFYPIPINLAFQKNNPYLRNIFNKALTYLVDRERFLKNFENSERDYLESKAKLATYYSYLFRLIIICILFSSLFIFYRLRAMKKKAELAFIDSLTTLGNRYSFDKFCNSFNSSSGVALVANLNNFKVAVDRYGHKTGDALITHCAQIFKKYLSHDRIFRISGEEYYAFLDEENFINILDKLKSSFDDSEFLKTHGISVSMGYYIKNSETDISDGFRYADIAVAQGKNINHTQYFEATEKLIKKMERKIFIKENLEYSIEKEFYPAYQPKFSLKGEKRLIGAEALARWRSKSMGMVFPDEFIHVAEDQKVIGKLDLKIAEDAIRQVKKWLEAKLIDENFVISFNISMITFEMEDVPGKIQEFLKIYGVDGKNIELEITESIFSRNMSETLEKLNRLKTLGATLSLDDFTAGHSTAGVLPLLPIDIVKFDRSLMLSMERDHEKGSIIYTSLINLVKKMGFIITAEGIENEEELDFLKSRGVENGQGYLFGKPLPENEFVESFLVRS